MPEGQLAELWNRGVHFSISWTGIGKLYPSLGLLAERVPSSLAQTHDIQDTLSLKKKKEMNPDHHQG